MRLIIAEKPSVAKAIAEVVDAREKQNGFFKGPTDWVSWAFGHLVEIAPPEAHGFHIDWANDTYPRFPTRIQLAVSEEKSASAQFAILSKLIHQASEVVCATDAGQEGELIFRYIYIKAGATAPVKRLWISSLTTESIRGGLLSLQPGSNYDLLYEAARTRSEADWLVGINLTRSMTVRHKSVVNTVISLGRVQTPTLSLVCQRFVANKTFKSTPFWIPAVELQFSNATRTFPVFEARVPNRYASITESQAVLQEIKTMVEPTHQLQVLSKSAKQQSVSAPPLFDLTSAQREANKRFSYSADKTLSLIQSLYEAGHVTYPRTDSQYLSEDMRSEVTKILSAVQLNLAKQIPHQSTLTPDSLNNKPFNSEKVTDHHAIIPTSRLPILNQLDEDLRIMYLCIVERFLQAFSSPCQQIKTSLTIGKRGHTIQFAATGTVIIEQGWKSIQLVKVPEELTQDEEENDQLLPPVQEGDVLTVLKVKQVEGKTTAPPLLTEGSLLGLMETAGQQIASGPQTTTGDQIAPYSLGTPATRASIIETLIHRQFMTRKGKSLIPSPFGLEIWKLTRSLPIGDPLTTGKWQHALNLIQQGKYDSVTFMGRLKQMITQCIHSIEDPKNNLSVDSLQLATCPVCKKGTFQSRGKFYGCSRYQEGCRFTLPLVIKEKKLSESTIYELCMNGRTKLIKGFSGKNGPFDAHLVLNPDNSLAFEFGKNQPKTGKKK